MARRSGEYLTPVQWLAEHGTWPDGPFLESSPLAVEYAAHWAEALAEALQGVNRSHLCSAIQIKRDTLYDILGGRTWADTITLIKLETHLDVSLWPAATRRAIRTND